MLDIEAPATFGARIKAARDQRELTLKQAAEAIGVSYTTLHNAEHGRRSHRGNRAKLAAWLEQVEDEHGRPRSPQITCVGVLLHAVFALQGLTRVAVAERIGVSQKHLSQIVVGNVGLSHELAFRLETVTGVPAAVWNAAEAAYRDAHIRQREASNV